ncbi:MAG: hypothetical protein OXP66_08200 [Candidatus Tectomicrobia bacterium]|nr:hypothetical protein [Candidatus Tectomicrobia bacterium]
MSEKTLRTETRQTLDIIRKCLAERNGLSLDDVTDGHALEWAARSHAFCIEHNAIVATPAAFRAILLANVQQVVADMLGVAASEIVLHDDGETVTVDYADDCDRAGEPVTMHVH